MNYELAKELKEAGFPQGVGTYLDEKGAGYYKHRPGTVCIPTLSELIEACGGWFHELIKRNDDSWYAGTKLEDNRPRYATGIGSTPEEAVARLWIALQEK
jgi:hypothetical protein